MSHFPLLLLVENKELQVVNNPYELPTTESFRVIGLNYGPTLVLELKAQFPELYDSVTKGASKEILISSLEHKEDLVRQQARAFLIFTYFKEHLDGS